MKPSTRKQKQRRRVSQIIGLALLVSFCAMAVPLPMSVPTKPPSEKDASEPFPCQNRPCGCRTAEQCWKKCCCFTNSQKVEWAKANSVKIPDFVLKAAGIEAASVSAHRGEACSLTTMGAFASDQKPATSCCSKSADAAAVVNDCAPATSSGCCSKCVPKKAVTHSKSRKKIVTGFNAAECQGIAFLVALLSTSVVSANVTIESAVAMRGELITAHSERLPLMSLRPPLPPPKIAA